MGIITTARQRQMARPLLAVLVFARHLATTGAHPGQDQAESARSAFETFFWRFEGKVFGYLWRMVGEEQSARDLTQETFLRAWQHFGELTPERSPAAWLFRVATHLALRHLRRRSILPTTVLDDAALPGSSDHGRRIAERDAVEQALFTLPPRQRSVLVLHEVYDLTCTEIGRILDISRDAAKMALWRARETFRASYLLEEEPR